VSAAKSKKPAVKPGPRVVSAPVRHPAYGPLLAGVVSAGFASLLYEVLWVRQLALSLGSTAIAGSTMLAAFLGGLAIGSWLVSRRVDADDRPLRLLVRVEIVAAFVGALSVPVLDLAGHAYVLAAGGLGAGPSGALLLRAAFSLVVILLPATLFGVAFPLASTAAARLVGPERAAGGVMAASSFGSALGAALGGLALEPLLGITGASLVAASLNILAAFAVWLAAYLSTSSPSTVRTNLEE
jgi:spermidine synthase